MWIRYRLWSGIIYPVSQVLCPNIETEYHWELNVSKKYAYSLTNNRIEIWFFIPRMVISKSILRSFKINKYLLFFSLIIKQSLTCKSFFKILCKSLWTFYNFGWKFLSFAAQYKGGLSTRLVQYWNGWMSSSSWMLYIWMVS